MTVTAQPKRANKKVQGKGKSTQTNKKQVATKKNAPKKVESGATAEQMRLGTGIDSLTFTTPKKEKITVSFELVNAETANYILENFNTANRKIDDRLVKSYIRKMETGQWIFNGDTLKFDKDGILRDGQNRLMAILISKIPQPCLVVRGLNKEAFSTMDEGRKRSASDILSIEKLKDPRKKAGVVRTVLLFDNGYYRSTKGGGDRSVTPNNFEILEYTREHNDRIEESLNLAEEIKVDFPYLNLKMLAAMHYIFAQKNRKDANAFFKALAKGEGLAKNSPIGVFRNEIVKDHKNHVKLPYNTVLALLIKSWNHYRLSETTQSITYDKGTEPFPMVK